MNGGGEWVLRRPQRLLALPSPASRLLWGFRQLGCEPAHLVKGTQDGGAAAP